MNSKQGVLLCVLVLMGLIGFSAVTVGQSQKANFIEPLIVDVRQEVPVLANVLVPLEDGHSITTTVPITVQLSLQVSIDGLAEPAIVTQSPLEIDVLKPKSTAGKLIDDLGIPYSLSIDSSALEITEWTVYVDVDGRLQVSGIVHQLANTPKVDDVLATVRMFSDGGELIEVTELRDIDPEPSGFDRFEAFLSWHPEQVARYEVEMRVFPPSLADTEASTIDDNQLESTGDSILMGGLNWFVVSSANFGNHYDEDGNRYSPVESTGGDLVAVSFLIENKGMEPINVTIGNYQGSVGNLRLKDFNGRKFAPVNDSYTSECQGSKIAQPSILLECSIVFEVVDGDAEYDLLFIDTDDNEIASVPLS